VALVDCNVTSPHLGLHFDLYNPPLSLNSVLKRESSVEGALYSYTPNLKFMPASIVFSDLEGMEMQNLKYVLRKGFEDFDFVFLDSAAGFGKEAMSTIMASDEILFVTNPDVPSVSDIIKGKEIVERLNKDVVGIVINRASRKKYELNRHEIENLAEIPVLEMIPEDQNVIKSIARKKPIVLDKPYSKASLGYLKLGGKLIGEDYQPTRLDRIKSFLNLK
jgi:septum site-determining protein MinD